MRALRRILLLQTTMAHYNRFSFIYFYVPTDMEEDRSFMGKRVAVVVPKSTATPANTCLARTTPDVVLNTTATSRRF